MSENVYNDSPYRFTSPIRYFKENDPYYYKVDNIPLKQLAENDEWLKDQITGILGASGAGSTSTEIDRSGFSELKPYVNGYDNVVRVKPGRFTARINDAYSITPLQRMQQVLGFNLGETSVWQFDTINSNVIGPAMQKFKSTLAADALNMNGLYERAFTYPVKGLRYGSNSLNNTIPMGSNGDNRAQPLYPNSVGFIGFADLASSSFNALQYNYYDANQGFENLGYIEALFTQKWRGAIRTSVVDIPNELTIEIPAFEPGDTVYTAEDGTAVNIPATQRIDLIFAYSKPIDASSTTIAKYVGGAPTTITEPALGLVIGTGLGINFNAFNTTARGFFESIAIRDANGVARILPSVGDETAVNTGLGGVKGSFPSPDDLMNIAPLLCETLETTNYALIGQSILPIAYVVVRQNAQTNETWGNILQTTDILDIRPFFRTTELAYNERAGIAAAVPQISFANPVASEGYVDLTARNIVQDYIGRINGISTTGTGGSTGNYTLPRVVAQGYIRGGYNYGVEGTLAKYLADTQGLSEKTRQINAIIQRYNLPANTIIEDLPDWDTAAWLNNTTSNQNPGQYPNDRINFLRSRHGVTWGSFQNQLLTTRLASIKGSRAVANTEIDDSFITKTIYLDRANVGWMGDYEVNVHFWNCSVASDLYPVFITKRRDSFTIFILLGGSIGQINSNNDITLRQNAFNSTFVLESGIGIGGGMYPTIHPASEPKYNKMGVCTYPTVSFEVVGIPTGYAGINPNLNTNQPTLVLA